MSDYAMFSLSMNLSALLLLIAYISSVASASSNSTSNQTSSEIIGEHYYEEDGTMQDHHGSIGVMFPMHLPGEHGKCSVKFSTWGMEILEAVMFAVEKINANQSLLPNFSFAVRPFDTCGTDRKALNKAIKEMIFEGGMLFPPIIGIIGPAFNYEAAHIATTLEIFEMPFISYSAASSELSNKMKYKYFSRTVPSDALQTKAIVDVLVHFNWTYISVLYTNDASSGYEQMRNEANNRGIYFANEEKVPIKYSKRLYQQIIQRVTSDPHARVVVVLCTPPVLYHLVKEIRKHPGHSSLQLITSETLDIFNNEETNELPGIAKNVNVLTLSPAGHPIQEFNEYFLNLNPKQNTRNPSFKEYFQEIMNCSLETNTSKKPEHKANCNPNATLASANYSTFRNGFRHVSSVVDGVYAIANAFHHVLARSHAFSGKHILESIRRETFHNPFGSIVSFSSSGDVSGFYDIYFIGKAGNKNYENIQIGGWKAHTLDLPSSEWKEKFIPVKSICSKPCGIHKVQQRIPGKPPCCWRCVGIPLEAFLVNETTVHRCPKGQLPDRKRKICVAIKAKYFSLDGKIVPSSFALIPVVVSILGILAVCFVAVVFLIHRDTPLVKASGRELCLILLVGLLLSFLFPLITISEPSPCKCLLQFVLYSLPLTICYVAVVVKNNRTFRIFNPERSLTNQLVFVRPGSQVVISLGLVSFQALILLALILLRFPGDEFVYPSSTEVLHVCVTSDTQVVLSHVYNIILLIVCTYYAFKTRRVPRNFNEAKYIAFAMYGSCVTVLAFAVILAVQGLDAVTKLAVYSFHNILLATILLMCFFGPKIYIIIWKSEENVNRSTVRSKPTPPCGDGSAGTEQSRDHSGCLNVYENIHMKGGSSISCSTQTE